MIWVRSSFCTKDFFPDACHLVDADEVISLLSLDAAKVYVNVYANFKISHFTENDDIEEGVTLSAAMCQRVSFYNANENGRIARVFIARSLTVESLPERRSIGNLFGLIGS